MLLGEGVGELAGACLAGALTRDDAARMVAARARAAQAGTTEPIEALLADVELSMEGLSIGMKSYAIGLLAVQ